MMDNDDSDDSISRWRRRATRLSSFHKCVADDDDLERQQLVDKNAIHDGQR